MECTCTPKGLETLRAMDENPVADENLRLINDARLGEITMKAEF